MPRPQNQYRKLSRPTKGAHIRDAPELANTPASSSKQAAQATPKGLLRLLCAGEPENVNQQGFYVDPLFKVGIDTACARLRLQLYKLCALWSWCDTRGRTFLFGVECKVLSVS